MEALGSKVTFNDLSDAIAVRLLCRSGLTVREANSMAHDLARAIMRPSFGGGEVPSNTEVRSEVIDAGIALCLKGLTDV